MVVVLLSDRDLVVWERNKWSTAIEEDVRGKSQSECSGVLISIIVFHLPSRNTRGTGTGLMYYTYRIAYHTS